MAIENSLYDKKSLKKVMGNTANFHELAKDCVAFANTRGGVIDIGIEDNDALPPAKQTIPDELTATIEKRISETTSNVNCLAEKIVAENGGEFVKLHISFNKSSIAGTSDGKFYMRVGDSSKPVKPDELSFILTDKTSFTWENKKTLNTLEKCDKEKLAAFLKDIRNAPRVSDFVKSKSDVEILKHYKLIRDGEYLTNLGTLWLGDSFQRADLGASPKIQVIKYDEKGVKINKFMYCDDDMSPKELIDAIQQEIPDWKEYYEIPNKLRRERVWAYEYKLIRELLINAFVHRPYTMGGEIFIKLYPDRMEIKNPGTLPMGITPENIFDSNFQRNEAFGKIFFDLEYMEKEGSGYHLLYQLLLLNGKPLPIVEEGSDWVKVTVMRKPVNDNAYLFMARMNEFHTLSQKQTIELGLMSQEGYFSIEQVAKILEMKEEDVFPIIDNIYSSGIISKRIDSELFILNGLKNTENNEKSQQIAEKMPCKCRVNAEKMPCKMSIGAEKTLAAIKDNPKSSNTDLCKIMNLSDRTVRNYIKELKSLNLITRIGSDKSGYWEVLG